MWWIKPPLFENKYCKVMEKSNLEILKEFAKSTNRVIVDKEIPYPVNGLRNFGQKKRMIYIPNNKDYTR